MGEGVLESGPGGRMASLSSRLVKRALLGFYRMQGWKAVGTPPPGGRYVIIAAPHTSNWDFVYFLGLVNELGLDAHFMAKDSLFRWPMGGFMRDMGGISIDRSARHNVVDAMIAEFARRDRFALTIAPEGHAQRGQSVEDGLLPHCPRGRSSDGRRPDGLWPQGGRTWPRDHADRGLQS